MIKYVPLIGSQLSSQLSALASLRIKIFNEFPYIYVGSEEDERTYLRVYEECPDSMIILVYDDEQVIGALTTIPFAFEHTQIQMPFVQQGFDLSRIFYCGELLLLPEYRGLGLGGRLFTEVDNRVHQLGIERFDMICGCVVQRPENHPLRPASFRPLDSFWQKFGYTKRSNLIGTFTWKDIGEAIETPKPMEFWIKPTAQLMKSGIG